MFIVKHTVETKATPIQIWKIWEDAENWKTWDQEIEFSRIDGPFQAGTTGCTKFAKTPVIKTLLTKIELHKLVVQEAYLSFAKVISYQSMSQMAGMTRVTFQVEIKGPLSFFYSCMLGRFIKKKIPREMEEMLKRVEALG
ncbi:MAG TPA: SRPBCC family protein [Rhabdochlamydiaceae bacterium]|nr:SRPBCC family protein [Rhabdochlamydiaceae bacterium]